MVKNMDLILSILTAAESETCGVSKRNPCLQKLAFCHSMLLNVPRIDFVCRGIEQATCRLIARVKSGKYGHKVNSDTHLQIV